MRYQLNIDVGVGSIGAVAFDLDKLEKEENPLFSPYGGVARIFPPAKGAAERSQTRSMQTQYQRRRLRLKRLKKLLKKFLSLDLAALAPIAGPEGTSLIRLRKEALERALSQRELYHVLLHIAKNRGMRLAKDKSKGTKGEEKKATDDKGDLASLRKIARQLEAEIERSGKTVAQYLFEEFEAKRIATRRRQRLVEVNPYIVPRKLVEEEFDRIVKFQASSHPFLSDPKIGEEVKNCIFWEADPKPAIRGQSCYENDGERLPRGTWLFEEKRLLEELNNLRVRDADGKNARPLEKKDRDRLYEILLRKAALSAKEIKKELFGKKDENHLVSIEKGYSNKEGAERTIKGHAIALAMSGTLLEENWPRWDEAKRDEVIEILRDRDDYEEIFGFMSNLFPKASEEELDKICDLSLPQGFSAAGRKGTEKLIKELRAEVISVDEAEKRAGLIRVTAPTGEIFNRLPYYGKLLGHRCQPIKANPKPHDTNEEQFGRIPNPVVHQFLNQLRIVVNDFIKKHGKPEKIAIELSRDLQKTQEERDLISRQNASNEKRNAARNEITIKHGKSPSRHYRRCLELHDLQGGICPYTGDPISIEYIFSGKADIDHILPRKDTLMDGMDNLVLALSDANRRKAKRSPYDAFGGGFEWHGKMITYSEIIERTEKYPPEKRWKFYREAMERFKDEDKFLKRFDGDTKWLGRVAIEYLRCLFDPKTNPIRVVRGGITAQLRDHWGIRNLLMDLLEEEGLQIPEKQKESAKKFREDHRHHLIDAIVIGLADAKAIRALKTFYALSGQERKKHRESGDIKLPWTGFRKSVEEFIADQRKVSQKSDHNINGQLHDQMALSLFAQPEDPEEKSIIYQRISFAAMNPAPGKKGRDLLMGIALDKSVLEAAQKIASGKIKAKFIFGAKDKRRSPEESVAYLEAYQQYLTQMREELLELYDTAPPQMEIKEEQNAGAKKAKKIPDDVYRLKYALREYSKRHNKVQSWKKYENFTIVTIRGKSHENTERPQGIYKGRSNSRLDIYLNAKLDLGWEVITRLNEMKKVSPKWKSDPNNKLLFSLRKDDEVEMVDKKGKSIIARIQNLSDGDIRLFPIEVASSDDYHPKKIRIKSLKAWQQYNVTPIVRSPLGEVKYRGKLRNR